MSGRWTLVRAGKGVGMVKAWWSVVKFVAVWIVQRESGVSRVEAGNALAKREIVKALRVGIVRQDCESVGHALFHGSLQRVVARVDVVNISLNGRREGVGLELCAAGEGVAVAGCHCPSGRLADREVCKTNVGLAIARYSRRRVVTGNASVVVLRLKNVEAS